MSLETDHYCPDCESDVTFYRAASTHVHLGEKIKWHCTECDYGFVKIDGNVDTSEA
jgi:rubredoxin